MLSSADTAMLARRYRVPSAKIWSIAPEVVVPVALLASILVDSSLGFSLTATLGGMLFSTDGNKVSTATGDAEGAKLGFGIGCSDGLSVAGIGLGFSVALP